LTKKVSVCSGVVSPLIVIEIVWLFWPAVKFSVPLVAT